METVGVRELKSKLSAYLRRAQRGAVLQVTDRGKAIAELVPAGWATESGLAPAVAAMAREGRLRLPCRPRSALTLPPGPRLPAGTAQRWLDEERGER